MSKKFLSGINVTGSATLNTVSDAGTNTDKFLVLNSSGVVSYRTAAELYIDLEIGNLPAGFTSTLKHRVKAGVALTQGQAVYVTNADGTNMIVGKASNASESTSSKTLGLIETSLSINGIGNVITEGLLAGLNTNGANAGDPVWLGTDGNLIFGLLNKPHAPAHLVFIGIVTRANANNGEIFVKVQNGFEMGELHNYAESGVQNNDIITWEYSSSLYKPKSISTILGYTPVNSNGTTNYIAKFTSANTIGNSIMYDDGSSIGINTTSPHASSQFKLDVNGGVIIKNTSGTTAQLVVINANPAGGGNNGFFQLTTGGTETSSYTSLQNYYGTSMIGGSLRLQPSGGTVLINKLLDSTLASLQVTGAIQQSTAVSTMLKADSNGVITAAIAGTDYADASSLSGYVPTSRTITINGVGYDLSADRAWSITSGVSSVTATGPLFSSGGSTPNITIQPASVMQDGYLSSTDWNTFNNKMSGSGSINFLPKFTGTSTLGNSIVYDGGSSIGINTTSPYAPTSFKLDVNGGLLIKNTSGVTAVLTLINSDPSGGGNNGWFQMTAGGSSETTYASIQTYYGIGSVDGTLKLQPNGGSVSIGNLAGSGNRMVVANSAGVLSTEAIPSGGSAQWTTTGSDIYYNTGNVGINQSSPAYKLDVTGTGRFTGTLLAGAANGNIRLTGATTDAFIGVNTSTMYLTDWNTASKGMVIDLTTGNVGIGTTSPDNTYQGLTIYGTNPSLRLKASASGSWTWTEYVSSSGVNNFSMGVSHSTPIFAIRAGAGLDNPHFAMTTSGNVSIGGISPSSKLEVQDGALGIYHNNGTNGAGYSLDFLTNGGGSKNTIGYISIFNVGTARSGDMIFATSNSGAPLERMRITSAGNVNFQGVGEFGPDSGNNNGIGIRYGNSGYGRIRFYNDGTNHSTIHSFGSSWSGGASVGYININGSSGVNLGAWNDADLRVPTGGQTYARGYRGIGNVAGTGEATYHPAGIYSTGTNWLYGTMYRNGTTMSGQGWMYLDWNYGHSVVGVYSATRYQGVWSMGDLYKLSDDGTSTGNLYGLAWSHPNAGGQAGFLTNHGLIHMMYGTAFATISDNIWCRNNITAYSDIRVKENIKVIENAMDKINAIRGVTFTRNDVPDTTKRHAGVIAQEIQKVLPEVITENTSNGHLSVAYGNIVGLTIEGLKEHDIIIKKQAEEIRQLKEIIYGLTK